MQNLIYFDSKNPHCKSPFGCVEEGTEMTFRIFAKDGVYIHGVDLQIFEDGESSPHTFAMSFVCKRGDESEFCVKCSLDKAGLYWYKFVFHTEKGDVGKDLDGKAYQLTVYQKGYATPDWAKGGVIYHIFVDRFCKGKDEKAVFDKKGVLKEWGEEVTIVDSDGVFRANDFYGGNFQGIIDKLDYLKGLGVTLLYLSPIFKSSSNHRYDTGDYGQIDPLLGDEDKFAELIAKAKSKGIEIMLDGVFNHTGADSKYFNKFGSYPTLGAYQSKESEYYDWFDFYNFPDEYHCWWGITVTPTVSQRAVGFRKMIAGKDGIIEKWTKMGVKGWRLDVVDELSEDFVKDIRSAVKKRDSQALLIGEVWEDASNKIAYSFRRRYFQGEELDGVMNYPFKEATLAFALGGNARDFENTVSAIVENYPRQSLAVTMNLIDSHDTARALSVLSGIDMSGTDKAYRRDFRMNADSYALAKKRLALAAALQFTLPGIPSIFYGDERGIQGYEDPLCRRTIDWSGCDSELLAHYKRLGQIRKKYSDVLLGETFFESQDGLLALCRKSGKKIIKTIANNTDCVKTYRCLGVERELLSGEKILTKSVEIYPNEVKIFLVKA
ncbi:MAG: glycoside hydrolase family 13 protein [Clostridia bacterium]|nr:glycoside hydrolase family 13 protein [Clostridia bacterium]MDE7328935.1 glycoside hydrolase family 13 protein [Clostridia bacterium]